MIRDSNCSRTFFTADQTSDNLRCKQSALTIAHQDSVLSSALLRLPLGSLQHLAPPIPGRASNLHHVELALCQLGCLHCEPAQHKHNSVCEQCMIIVDGLATHQRRQVLHCALHLGVIRALVPESRRQTGANSMPCRDMQ